MQRTAEIERERELRGIREPDAEADATGLALRLEEAVTVGGGELYRRDVAGERLAQHDRR